MQQHSVAPQDSEAAESSIANKDETLAAAPTMALNHSRLLALPPELRIQINEHLACSEPPHLSPEGVLEPDLRLGRTNHQLRNEFLHVFHNHVRKRAEVIRVRVEDFEFSYVIQLLKTLLPPPNGAKRTLEVELFFSRLDVRLKDLNDWLRRCETDASFALFNREYTTSLDSDNLAVEFAIDAVFEWRRSTSVMLGRGDSDAFNMQSAMLVASLKCRLEKMGRMKVFAVQMAVIFFLAAVAWVVFVLVRDISCASTVILMSGDCVLPWEDAVRVVCFSGGAGERAVR